MIRVKKVGCSGAFLNWVLSDGPLYLCVSHARVDMAEIDSVIANGSELRLIKKQMFNLPEASNKLPEVYWSGDHARFIVANLM